jgi:hypothetical protein
MAWRPLSTIQFRVGVRDSLVRMLGTRMNTLHIKTTSCQRRSAMGILITDHNKADVLIFITVNRWPRHTPVSTARCR